MKKLFVLLMLMLLTACSVGRPTIVDNTTDGQSQEEVQEEFTVGETKDYSYSNDYFNFRIDLDSDWYIANDKELVELQNAGVDMIDNEYAKKIFDEGQAAFVFYAQNLSTSENIQVIVEGLPLGNLKTEQVIKNTMAALEETYKSQGYEVNNVEMVDIDLNGRKEKGILSNISFNGTSITQKQINIAKDKYYLTVAVTALNEDSANEIFKKMSSVK